MKPKSLLILFLIVTLSYHARAVTFKRDTAVTVEQAKKIRTQNGTAYPRSRIKGYKKKFDNCSFTNRYSTAERLKQYPYATAFKIMAVSYYGGGEPNEPIRLASDTGPKHQLSYKQKQHYKGLVIKNRKLDYFTLIETKVLNQQQVADLTNIIFNYEYAGMKDYTITGSANCFFPRNSIIFFDKNVKIFDHLDICFSCHRYDSGSNKLDVGTACAQKFDMLARFFIKAGIRYGADNKVPLD